MIIILPVSRFIITNHRFFTISSLSYVRSETYSYFYELYIDKLYIYIHISDNSFSSGSQPACSVVPGTTTATDVPTHFAFDVTSRVTCPRSVHRNASHLALSVCDVATAVIHSLYVSCVLIL